MEFSYPPLMPAEGHDSPLLPEEWRYLPFLALPDGAHNFQEGRPHEESFMVSFLCRITFLWNKSSPVLLIRVFLLSLVVRETFVKTFMLLLSGKRLLCFE